MALDPASIHAAAQLIADADALLVGAGAGMGVDSGLPDFRGTEGFWRSYPALGQRGLKFYEVANPRTFDTDPALAWGFYGHRLALYRGTKPHAGFEIIRYRAGRIAVLLAVLHGPFFAASLWMTHQSGNGWFSLLIIRRLWDGPRFELAASAEVWWLTGSLACSLLGEMLFGVGLSTLVRHWVEGTDATAGSVLRTTGRRLPVILSVWLVALVVKAAGLALCGVGILLVLPHLSILAQVMSFERGNVASWISRSRQLVNRASERALFLTLMAPLLSFGALWTLLAGAVGGSGAV